jgi:uncharacterized protein involved in exopolysaccharide biosynthesis
MNNDTTSTMDSASYDIIALMQVALMGWKVITVLSLGLAVLTYLISLFMTPIYRVEVQLSSSSEQASSLGAMAQQSLMALGLGGFGGVSESNKSIENIAIIRSRRFTEEFIRDHDLLPVLFSDRWDSEKEVWLEKTSFFRKPGKRPRFSEFQDSGEAAGAPNSPTMWQANVRFNQIRFVSTDSLTGLITLSLEWENPYVAARMANDLVADLNRYVRTLSLAEEQRVSEFLRAQLQGVSSVELRKSISTSISESLKQQAMLNASENVAFTVMDPAFPPEIHTTPKRKIMTMLGFIVGGLAGFGIALWRQGRSLFPEARRQSSAL